MELPLIVNPLTNRHPNTQGTGYAVLADANGHDVALVYNQSDAEVIRDGFDHLGILYHSLRATCAISIALVSMILKTDALSLEGRLRAQRLQAAVFRVAAHLESGKDEEALDALIELMEHIGMDNIGDNPFLERSGLNG